jgi:hypothetical protein
MRTAFLFFAMIFIAFPAFPASLKDVLEPGIAAELESRGTITGVQSQNPLPVLIPRHAAAQSIIDNAMKDLEPGFLVEHLSLYKKPTGAVPGGWTEAERIALYNQALALSTLAGISYFSTSRNAMRILYETSTVIDGPDTENLRPDPVYRTPPQELTLYARHRDSTFGENIYRYVYYASPDALIFVQENMTDMKAGIIRMVGRNNLRTAVVIIDVEDRLLIYIVSMAKAASVPGMARRVSASFSTRAEAILKWFSGQADKAFGP